jgi:hypothetical protein
VKGYSISADRSSTFYSPQKFNPKNCERCKRRAHKLVRHTVCAGGAGLDLCTLCAKWIVGSSEPTPSPAQKTALALWRDLFRVPRRPGEIPGGYFAPPAAAPTRIGFANFAESERRVTYV